MGYSPWGHKESDTTQQLTLSDFQSLVEGWGRLFHGTSSHSLCLSKCQCARRPPAEETQEAGGRGRPSSSPALVPRAAF